MHCISHLQVCSWVQGKIAIVVKGLHKETDPSLAMLKKAKQGRVQQGAYGFRFLLTLTLPGIMGNAAELGCRATSDFAASCTALPDSTIHAHTQQASFHGAEQWIGKHEQYD